MTRQHHRQRQSRLQQPTPASTAIAATEESEPTAEEVEGRIVDFVFKPASVTTSPSTTVVWVNDGLTVHTTTSQDGVWDSSTRQAGEEFRFTFEDLGEFESLCTPHPSMIGTVTVEEVTAR